MCAPGHGPVTKLSPEPCYVFDMQGLILVIEDEVDLATTLEYNLEREGYQTRVAHTGQDGLDAAFRDPVPDAIILDLMLPDLSGTEVCRRLRESDRTRDVPVLMCTAKGSEIDRVVGFEVGADDYIVKPFSVRELILRIRAVLRRAQRVDAEPEVVRFGRLRVDREAHRVWVDDAEVSLTALEFRLLYAFLSRRAGSRPATRCCPTSGASTPTSRPAPSTPTSSGCARSSARPARTSRPCAASATVSATSPTRREGSRPGRRAAAPAGGGSRLTPRSHVDRGPDQADARSRSARSP